MKNLGEFPYESSIFHPLFSEVNKNPNLAAFFGGDFCVFCSSWDVVGRASFKRRYFLYHNWEWKLVYYAELDLLQLFNVIKEKDPSEKNNLLAEEPKLAAELEQRLLEYLETVEGRTYRSILSKR